RTSSDCRQRCDSLPSFKPYTVDSVLQPRRACLAGACSSTTSYGAVGLMPAQPSELSKTGRWPLRLGFVLIIAIFGLSNLVSLYEMRGNQAQNQLIVQKMLASTELLFRLERDIDRKRLLVDDHIFEKQRSGMEEIERRIAEVEDDFAKATRAYIG